jgi:methylmalonyl-CoA/ethylmalonyl-CoA epimerase
MIRGLHHIGIAVADLEEACDRWLTATGGTLLHTEIVEEQGVEVAVITVGDLRIELLRALSESSPIAKFIAARGEGIHHLALESDGVQSELDRLKAASFRLIDETARPGAEETRVGFMHPRSLRGVLVEMVERR